MKKQHGEVCADPFGLGREAVRFSSTMPLMSCDIQGTVKTMRTAKEHLMLTKDATSARNIDNILGRYEHIMAIENIWCDSANATESESLIRSELLRKTAPAKTRCMFEAGYTPPLMRLECPNSICPFVFPMEHGIEYGSRDREFFDLSFFAKPISTLDDYGSRSYAMTWLPLAFDGNVTSAVPVFVTISMSTWGSLPFNEDTYGYFAKVEAAKTEHVKHKYHVNGVSEPETEQFVAFALNLLLFRDNPVNRNTIHNIIDATNHSVDRVSPLVLMKTILEQEKDLFPVLKAAMDTASSIKDVVAWEYLVAKRFCGTQNDQYMDSPISLRDAAYKRTRLNVPLRFANTECHPYYDYSELDDGSGFVMTLSKPNETCNTFYTAYNDKQRIAPVCRSIPKNVVFKSDSVVSVLLSRDDVDGQKDIWGNYVTPKAHYIESFTEAVVQAANSINHYTFGPLEFERSVIDANSVFIDKLIDVLSRCMSLQILIYS